MMRVTNAIFLVGLLLAGTLLVPYDYATRNMQPKMVAAQPFQPSSQIQIPPGKVLLPFPDFWNGATTATIYESQVYIPQTIGVNPGKVELMLPAGMIVYPGSRWLNISLDAPALPREAQFEFEFMSADDRAGVRGLGNHATYALRLEEAMNDWAPDTHTRWRFIVYNSDVTGVEATIKITIAREPGLLPAHVFVADRWYGQDARVVYDRKDALRQSTVWRHSVPLPEDKGPATSVPLHKIPALDLQELQVHLYYNSSTPANVHYRPLLSWNSPRGDGYSNDRANVPPTAEHRAANGHFLWRIPVHPEMYDNPLGTRSRWQVSVDWQGNSTNPQEYQMDGNYHFTILAHRNLAVEPVPSGS